MTLTVTGMKIRMQEKVIHSKLSSEFGRKVPAEQQGLLLKSTHR